MTREALDDQARWAEAQSLLTPSPTESAEQRLARWRRLQVLLVMAVVLGTTAAAVVLVVLFRGTFGAEPPEDVPTWQVILGFAIAGAGLVLQFAGVVTLWRGNRRARVWRSPIAALKRAQRKELVAQVRGHRPVDASHLSLARNLAEQRVSSRNVLVANLGLGIAFVGQWIAVPSVWQAGLACVYVVFFAIGAPLILREVRRARRFLQEHPAATDLES